MEPRLCRCGCGTPLRSTTSEFAPGHHMRLAVRSGFGGATQPVRERPLCACGCGEPTTPGYRFRRGHHLRSPEWRLQRYGEGNVRGCLVCGKPVRVPLSQDKSWGYCGPLHYAQARLKVRPWNRLQKRIFEYMVTHHLTLLDFAAKAEVNYDTFRSWLKKKGSATASRNLVQMAAVLGIPEAQALDEANGQTAELVRNEKGRRIGARAAAQWLHTADAHRAQAASRRGKQKSAATREKIRAAIVAKPDMVMAARARIANWSASFDGRAVLHLTQFRRRFRRPAFPAPEQVRQHAERVADQMGTKPAVILGIWRPYLQKAYPDQWPKGGRPRKDDRLQRYLELRASWPRKRDGRAADGLLPRFKKLIEETEGKRLSMEAVKQWVAENAPADTRVSS